MNTYKIAETTSSESVASLTTFLISAWFLVAGGVMLAEPSVDEQLRAVQANEAKTPVVTVREITAYAEPQARETIVVVAKREAARVS